MGWFRSGPEMASKTYKPKPLSGRKAAKVARRGGTAIAATTSAPRPGRAVRARGGSR